ncbi:MAG: toxin [Deltaproteobacteria bacterium]|nr:toxin [Deltaproteobacteria bacterium]MBW2067225.1 toxin [Deltaproteobacteria bacterium]
MEYYKWDHHKNELLKAERGISFEEIILHIERGDVLDILIHPNQFRYPNQQMLVVKVKDYAYLIPFVEDENGVFLKTIIPSRKATREYLGGKGGKKKAR